MRSTITVFTFDTCPSISRFELNKIPEDRRNVFQFNFNMYLSGMKVFNPETTLKLDSKKSAGQIAMMQSPISITDQTLYISGDVVIPVQDVVRVCCSGSFLSAGFKNLEFAVLKFFRSWRPMPTCGLD